MPDAIRRWKPTQAHAKPAKETAHYRTADWAARRLRILVRDAYTCRTCRLCVQGRDAHVDHILPLEDGGTDGDLNLQVLCVSCHGAKTKAEQRAKGY
jgi:5-methylcytosine-specific restriction endonuclease McrA